MQQRIIKKEFPLISIISQESLNSINDYLKKSGSRNRYMKDKAGGNIIITRASRNFHFWDRLMRERKAVDL